MELDLSQKTLSSDSMDLINQNKKLVSDAKTESLMRQAAVNRSRELQNELYLEQIRAKTAEDEWKEGVTPVSQ